MGRLERFRTPVTVLLVLLIIAGGAVLGYRQASLPRGTEILIHPPPSLVYVQVEGQVVAPGVYSLPQGAIVADAVEAAGGFTSEADRAAVNLLTVVRDGNRVYVPGAGEVPQRVNINTAEAWLLTALPGIGDTLAARIIAYRAQNGPFQDIEDLKSVEGIGTATFERLKDMVTVH